MRSGRRSAALVAAEEQCPRCGSAREPAQEYCVDCGLRLPIAAGRLASLRRRWIRRVGWYPGDWVWLPVLALPIAGAAAAGAILVTTSEKSTAPTTTVVGPREVRSVHEPASPSAKGRGNLAPASGRKSGRAARAKANGPLDWPSGRNGWTIVLVTYPVTGGRAAPFATAERAASRGLPQVGVLVSADYASLHPGYYVVFSGLYPSAGSAEAAVRAARASGFPASYSKRVSH
jgi:hypothetical protein